MTNYIAGGQLSGNIRYNDPDKFKLQLLTPHNCNYAVLCYLYDNILIAMTLLNRQLKP